jgi:hypothetical protein
LKKIKTMKKLIILIVCFYFTLSATAQVRFSAGLGANTSIFVSSVDSDVNYIPKVMPNFNLQIAIRKGEGSAFSGIVQVNLSPKRIGTKMTAELSSGQVFAEGFTHYIGSGELLLGASLDFGRKNITIRPHAGIFLALNQINGHSAYSISNSAAIGVANYGGDERPLFVYPGVNLGCSVVKRMFNNSREAALFAEAYYAPRDIFSEPFNYSWFGNDNVLQGKYHALNVGIRMDLNKS